MTPPTHPTRPFLALAAITLLLAAGCDAGDRPPDAAVDAAIDSSAAASRDAEPAAGAGGAAAYARLRSAVCDTLTNTFDCARAIEARQLDRFPGATRSGDTLRLTVEGDTVVRVDSPSRGADAEHFSLQDHWPDRRYWVVQKQYYEGSEYLLIDQRTGESTTLPDWPLRSPDGGRFAVLSLDLVAGYGPNTLQIWDFDEDGGALGLEWETTPERWGPRDGHWFDAGTLRFHQHGECAALDLSGTGLCDRPARVVRTRDGWRIEAGGDGPGTADGDPEGVGDGAETVGPDGGGR